MTVKELTNMLYEVGDGSSEVQFKVMGQAKVSEELDGTYHGTYEFPVEFDRPGEFYSVERNNDGLSVIVSVGG